MSIEVPPGMSAREYGVYCWLLDHPEDASIAALAARFREGQEAMATVLRGLRVRGLLPTPLSNRCRVCHGVRAQRIGVTYVAQRGGWVKIGHTARLTQRLRELGRAWPSVRTPRDMDVERSVEVALVASFDGDVEHELHERFADCHVVGEWFSLGAAALAALIAEAAA